MWSRFFWIISILSTIYVAYFVATSKCPELSSLKGKTVLITGCSSGIGVELAVQYAHLGADLVIAARRASALAETAELARKAGAKVVAVPTDMSNRTAVEELIATTVANFGGIDLLVLNHASVDDALLLEYEDGAKFEAAILPVIQANVLGSMYATYAALPYLSSRRGHIAVISSASTIAPSPFHSAYVASKRALGGFFETLRHEFHLSNTPVTIGIQILGMIRTPPIAKDPKLATSPISIPVPDAAHAMICASEARWETAYVPQFYYPMTTALQMLTASVRELAINWSYIFNVDDYLKRILTIRKTGGPRSIFRLFNVDNKA